MLVSTLFSFAIYGNVASQIERLIHMQNERIQKFQNEPPLDMPRPPDGPPMISTEELIDQKRQLIYTLVIINLGVFVVAGGAGYLLAGKTLHPIKLMVDEQNQFISDASHELRTPIATLQAEMEGELLEKKISDKQARALIESNLEELGNLKHLANRLLQLNKIHHFDNNSKKEKLSIVGIIELAKNSTLSLAKKKKIDIKIKVPEIVIKGKKDTLIEVFTILFDNAIKFSPKGSKIIVKAKKINKKVQIEVLDKGVGISKKDLPHIFERFYRADKSRSATEGFGLGLSIAKKTIESHKGSIKVKSIVNKGTTFTIELPLVTL